ncbi:TPA: YcgJ family protein [Serratia liquefaciens]
MKIKSHLPTLVLFAGVVIGLAGVVIGLAGLAQAQTRQGLLLSPHPGVLCDRYFCADKEVGVSVALTRQYLGTAEAEKLVAQGEFDKTAFTYANGVFCDLAEKQCRSNRYFDAQGHRSGEVLETETRLLFGDNADAK